MNQLALPLTLDDYAVFDSFYATGNEEAVASLRALAASGRGPGCWLWGPTGAGKSHLLQATVERFGDESVYVPMALLTDAGPAVLADLEARRCVCIDDLDVVAGNEGFEHALFDLWHRLDDRGGILVVSASSAPREASIALPDLGSRLMLLPVFRLAALDEHGRISALQLRAEQRGLELPTETARYLLTRHRRDMESLYRLLDRLDTESLKARRRLTIPFVRDVLSK